MDALERVFPKTVRLLRYYCFSVQVGHLKKAPRITYFVQIVEENKVVNKKIEIY